MKLEEELREHVAGEVHFDAIHRHVYSVDASIFEVEPIGIVLPKSREDLIRTVQIAKNHNIPVIARGAATGITGGCIGKALIIDTSKYLNRILEINYEKKYAICEPGVVQDRLNEALAEKGYRLGPDTSTGNRATLGGMVANNAAGARSLLYGTMVDHVNAIELLLASGEVLRFQELNLQDLEQKCLQQDQEGRIYRTVERIRSEYHHDIERHFPKIPRRVSGYNLDTLLRQGPLNLCQLLVGSEGTLGIFSEIQVKICKRPRFLGLCVVHFHDMIEGLKSVETMLQFHPIALEMIDDKIINMGKMSPVVRNKLGWLRGTPQAVLIAEFEGEAESSVLDKLSLFATKMEEKSIGYAHINITNALELNNVWEVRKMGLGLLLSKRTYSRAIAFIEDLSIPPQQLASFMERFCRYLKTKGKEAGIYGHVGSGCMHIRPYIDLRSNDEVRLMEQMMKDISELVLEHGGALSGEHGDGFIRSWLNKKMFGSRIYQGFTELKTAFDPENRMNPGKIVYGPPVTENLRLSPETKQVQIKTFLDFHDEGGIALAADLCNGNGQCRKSEKVMCPSFQATHDEFHTTRARAQTLRDIFNGRLPAEEFSGEGLHAVLDLCLECKGCKTECPSSVDMAKMKSEFLYHYHNRHGASWRDWLFAHIGKMNAAGSPFASFINFAMNNFVGKAVISLLGITPKRAFPKLSQERFSTWFNNHVPSKVFHKKVVLFNDTFTEFNQPEIGKAAVQVLESFGYEVIVPPWKCCGRPAISKGMLEYAKQQAEQIAETLMPYASKGLSIIGMEPSCLLTIKDDLSGLLGHDHPAVTALRNACVTFDEFVCKHIEKEKLPLEFKNEEKTVYVHGHCHQKALVGVKPTLEVLRAIPGLTVREIDSGCCGLAGSFGYEKEHYELSMKIGELKLFPAVRSSSETSLLVADGFSCRSQISHGTGRSSFHLAQVIVGCLKN